MREELWLNSFLQFSNPPFDFGDSLLGRKDFQRNFAGPRLTGGKRHDPPFLLLE